MNSLARPAVDSWLSISSNRAGTALPSIPRRRSAPKHLYSLADSASTSLSSSSSLPTLQHSSTSPQRSPPISKITPISIPASFKDEPLLPLDLKVSISGPASAPATPALVADATVVRSEILQENLPPRPTSVPPMETLEPPIRILRKKSGEPIKSSLKSPRRPAAEGLSLLTIAPSYSISAPTTPGGKSVHFDAQLEHVKLFLAEQRPTAVSRSGSPHEDDTGDSDFPSFIYGPSKSSTSRQLTMTGNTSSSAHDPQADVCLLSMELADESTSVVGRVQVRNIAFEKWIAIRFTFDDWQTTSEVTAKYLLSKNNGASDVFSFTIRLNDLMSRIESRKLLLAIRYTTNGRDIWDNNGGKNYSAKFSWADKPQPAPVAADNGSRALKALTSRLEAVAKTRNQSVHSPSFLVAGADSGESSPVSTSSPASFGSLSGRYNFKASLRNNPWSPPAVDSPKSQQHHRSRSQPNTIPWPSSTKQRSKPLASPRALDGEDVDSAAAKNSSGPKFESFEMSPSSPGPNKNKILESPAGYFDLPKLPEVLPPPQQTSPRSPEMVRFNSFPPKAPASHFNDTHYLPVWAELSINSGGSEESTPSMTSPTTSSRSDSPEPDSSSPKWATASSSFEQPNTEYNNILERMCFFTGGMDGGIHRSNSDTLLASSSPPTVTTPTRRSPSFDDYYYRSGSTTPTARSSALATPIVPASSSFV